MRLLRDKGLTIALMLLFSASIVGQLLSGWHVTLEDAARHNQTALSLAAYIRSPQFLSSVFENWESEFLQMSPYVVLTAICSSADRRNRRTQMSRLATLI
jgi:hypothetical protein